MSKKRNRFAGIWVVIFMFCIYVCAGRVHADHRPEVQYIYQECAEDGMRMVIVSLNGKDETIDHISLLYEKKDGSPFFVEAAEVMGSYAAFLVEEAQIEEATLQSIVWGNAGQEESISIAGLLQKEDTITLPMDEQTEQEEDDIVAEKAEEIPEILEQIEESVDPENMTFGVKGSLNKGIGNIVVVLDPGHGGYEAGAVRTWNKVSYIEKDIVLKIAQYTKQELEKYEGVTVYLTRDTDTYLTLTERVDFAAKMGATVLISQHINSTSENKTTATGAEVMVSSGNYKPSQAAETAAVARKILEELQNVGFKSRDLVYRLSETGNKYPNGKLADYYGIVRQSVQYGFPGMIVEHGFVSNPEDCKNYYGSEEKLQMIGAADAKAIASYYGLTGQNYNMWQEENGNWYYIDANGNRLKNQWVILDGRKYYLNSEGYRLNGWKKINQKQYFFGIDGIMRTGLVTTGGEMFWFTPQGVMRKGFFKTADGNWYYTNSKGYLYTGWKTYKGNRYYFHKVTGAAIVGWRLLGRHMYYFDESGKMQTGLLKIDGKKYFLRPSGRRAGGLVKYNNKRYYFDEENGVMVRNQWVNVKGNWYFLRKNGVAYCNTVHVIDNKKYRFDKKGICLNKRR